MSDVSRAVPPRSSCFLPSVCPEEKWRLEEHRASGQVHGGGFHSHCFFNCSMKMFLNFVSLKSSSFFLTLARASAPPRGLAVFSSGGSLIAFLILVPILFPSLGYRVLFYQCEAGLCDSPTSCLVIPALQQSPGAHASPGSLANSFPSVPYYEGCLLPRKHKMTRPALVDSVPEAVGLSQALTSP